MKFRRQLLKPGRRIEQISTLHAHPFFTRRRVAADADGGGAGRDAAPPAPAPTRGLLPRIAENAGALFSILVSLLLIAVIVALVVAFVAEVRRESVVVLPIGVPQDVAARGYIPTAASQLVVNEIVKIQRSSQTSHALRPLIAGSDIPDVHILGANTSMQSIVRYARSAVGHREPTIDGIVLRDGAGLRMVINLQDAQNLRTLEVARSDDEVEGLLEDGARAIVQLADPYVLASYLYWTEDPASGYPRTRAAIDYVLRTPPPDDDAWALNLWGLLLSRQGEYAAAEQKYRQALAMPHGPTAIIRKNLVYAMLSQGHREAARALLEEPAMKPDATFDVLDAACQGLYWIPEVRTEVYCTRALALRKDANSTLFWRGLREADTGRLAAAARDIEAARRASAPDDLFWTAGQVYVDTLRGDTATALAHAAAYVQQIPAESPNTAWLHVAHAAALNAAGRQAEALAELAAFDRDARVDRWTRFFATSIRGEVELAQHEPARALAHFDEALADAPGFVPALAGRAAALAALGRPAESDAAFQRAVEAGPDREATWRAWASALAARGDATGAAAKRAEADRAAQRGGG